VLIDLQNGILGRKLEPISAADLVERGKTLAGRFRAAGALVALVNVAPATEEPPRRVDEPSTLPNILPEGFVDFAPGLAEPSDLKITKKSWGAFSVPELDLKLRGAGELSGGKQWGVSDVAMEALKNIKLVEAARSEATRIIREDPELKKYPALAARAASAEAAVHPE